MDRRINRESQYVNNLLGSLPYNLLVKYFSTDRQPNRNPLSLKDVSKLEYRTKGDIEWNSGSKDFESQNYEEWKEE